MLNSEKYVETWSRRLEFGILMEKINSSSLFKTKNIKARTEPKTFYTLFLNSLGLKYEDIIEWDGFERIKMKDGTLIRCWRSYEDTDKSICLNYTIYKTDDMEDIGNGIKVPKSNVIKED